MSDNSETQWEYKIRKAEHFLYFHPADYDYGPTDELVELGAEGWELVGFHGDDAYFKRRKAPKNGVQSIFED